MTLPPTTIRWWRTVAAQQCSSVHVNNPLCEHRPDGSTRPCNAAPQWVAAWSANESRLPGLGEKRKTYLCDGCLVGRIRLIPFKYVGSVTLTPYEEISS
jgi:hypothetical protein